MKIQFGQSNTVDMFIVFSSRSTPLFRLGFLAISEADVHDLPLRRASFCRVHVQTVRFANLRYLISQLCDAFFDGILHDDRLAERKAPEHI
jgi:hypothetical protein